MQSIFSTTTSDYHLCKYDFLGTRQVRCNMPFSPHVRAIGGNRIKLCHLQYVIFI